jgi:hypothetical protein
MNMTSYTIKQLLSRILTLISLKTTVPHKEAMIDGPVETIGNATGIDKDLLATNQQLVAMDHIIPEIIPGSIAFGIIAQLCRTSYSFCLFYFFPNYFWAAL